MKLLQKKQVKSIDVATGEQLETLKNIDYNI